MRIKIIANIPPENTWGIPCSDITRLIGKDFEAVIENDKVVAIASEETGILDVFDGEYEVIEE